MSDVDLLKHKDEYSSNEDIIINVQFSLIGSLRESFTEENWTKAYNKNDNQFKLKYKKTMNLLALR